MITEVTEDKTLDKGELLYSLELVFYLLPS